MLDFPFHPGTAFWFDHHLSPFKKEVWQKKFHEDAAHAYRPQYFSCCHVAYDLLERNFKWQPPAYFKKLVAWLDVIDGARYVSAKQTILMKEPAFAVDNFIDLQGGDPKKSEWLIRLLAAKPLDTVAKISVIAAAGGKSGKERCKTWHFIENISLPAATLRSLILWGIRINYYDMLPIIFFRKYATASARL